MTCSTASFEMPVPEEEAEEEGEQASEIERERARSYFQCPGPRTPSPEVLVNLPASVGARRIEEDVEGRRRKRGGGCGIWDGKHEVSGHDW